MILLKHPWEFVEGETLPDIFDPAFEQLIESRAEAACMPVADDPLVIGYYYGFGAFNRSQHWMNHHLSLAPDSPGRNTIVDLLKHRYDDDVQKFNRVYGTDLGQIDDLKQTDVLSYDPAFERRNFEITKKTLDPQKLADFGAILSHMCVTLYKIAHTAIRRWDRNHLILGPYIKEWALTGDSWKAAAPYIDMIAPQHLSLRSRSMSCPMPQSCSFWYQMTILELPRKGTGHPDVSSHDACAEIYQANLMRHYKDPQVLGVTYCACMYDKLATHSKGTNRTDSTTCRAIHVKI